MLLVRVIEYAVIVVDIEVPERLPTANAITVPVEVILLTLPVITVPPPVPEEEEKYRMNVRGPVKVTLPARAG